MQAYTRLSAVTAVLGDFRKLLAGSDLQVVIEAHDKDSYEALAIIAEHVTGEAIGMLNSLHDAAELWEARAKEAGWKAEEDAPTRKQPEDGEARDREQKALIELALLDSTPIEAIKAARVKLHMLCLEAKDDK